MSDHSGSEERERERERERDGGDEIGDWTPRAQPEATSRDHFLLSSWNWTTRDTLSHTHTDTHTHTHTMCVSVL